MRARSRDSITARGVPTAVTSTTEALDQSTKSQIDAVEGWLTDREAAFLYHAAHTCAVAGEIVEIGSFKENRRSASVWARARAGVSLFRRSTPTKLGSRPRTTKASRRFRSSSKTSRGPGSAISSPRSPTIPRPSAPAGIVPSRCCGSTATTPTRPHSRTRRCSPHGSSTAVSSRSTTRRRASCPASSARCSPIRSIRHSASWTRSSMRPSPRP